MDSGRHRKTTTSSSHRIVYLMGMKHCGKSTLGTLLAEKWKAPFFDLDGCMVARYIEERRSAPNGPAPTIRAVYRRLGSERFKELEAAAARELIEESALTGEAIVALGGGTIENRDAIEALGDSGVFVYLEENAEVLYARIKSGGIPPFLSGPDPHGAFVELYRRRTQLYRQKASITVPLAGLPGKQAFSRLQRMLEEYLNGRE